MLGEIDSSKLYASAILNNRTREEEGGGVVNRKREYKRFFIFI